jgi:putative glutamine amidotransferase
MSAMKSLRLLIAFLLFVSFSAFSGEIELVVWKGHPKIPAMILPIKKGQELSEVVANYEKLVLANEDLANLATREKFSFSHLKTDVEYLDRVEIDKSFSPHFLLIANSFDDLTTEDRRVGNFFGPITENGGKAYLLPIAADLGLTPSEAKEYREAVAESFDALFGLGGDDVDPRLYGQNVTFAQASDIVPARDASEVELIRHFTQKEKGVYYGVCRGSQICAVARGEELVQDLAKEQGVTEAHRESWHKINLLKKDDNLLRQFLDFANEIEINSYHHQALKPREGMNMNIVGDIGKNHNYVVEAWQFQNHMGLALQFHPELMETEEGRKIMRGMVRYAGFVKRERLMSGSCENLALKFLHSR